MGRIEMQAELLISSPPKSSVVPTEMIHAKRTSGTAFTLACDASGLDDKEIYIPLEMDAATFSRIKSGTNSFPADRLADFCRLVGNNVYPEWLAYQVGCGLVLLKSEAERRAEHEKARADEAEKKLAWAMELLQGRAK